MTQKSRIAITSIVFALFFVHNISCSIHRHALTNMMGNGTISQSAQTRSVTAAASTPTRTCAADVLPNSFMPTSVMRQMTKNNNMSTTVEEKPRPSNMPICSTQYNSIKQNVVQEQFNAPHKR